MTTTKDPGLVAGTVAPAITSPPVGSVVASLRTTLANAGHPGLRQVHVDFDDGTARLSGRVRSFYLKQVAQELILRAESVKAIDNRLQVKPR